ncbi:MAG: hypothetical protein JRE47_12855 [Deltaproteobacteria bacterium]|nr:hypothetical protein [Deltaproteobacteria bacterium]
MSGEQDKNIEIEKIIQSDENLKESSYKEITSNTSDTTEDIPDFTTGDGDSSGGNSSSDTESTE